MSWSVLMINSCNLTVRLIKCAASEESVSLQRHALLFEYKCAPLNYNETGKGPVCPRRQSDIQEPDQIFKKFLWSDSKTGAQTFQLPIVNLSTLSKEQFKQAWHFVGK